MSNEITSERQAFEAACPELGWMNLTTESSGWYVCSDTRHAWEAWLARAAIAAEREQSPATLDYEFPGDNKRAIYIPADQSPAVDHAAMVAKISQLKVISSEMQVSYSEMRQDLADAETNHAAMVAKLKELSDKMEHAPYLSFGIADEWKAELSKILSTEPADPVE